jgi:hypothetical protein
MRVTRAFSRLLGLEGIWVRRVAFLPDRVVVRVALRRRRLICPLCLFSTPHRYNQQSAWSTSRHLDLGLWRLEIRAPAPPARVSRARRPGRGACRSPGIGPGSRATSRRSSGGGRPRWTRARSAAWCGSTGQRSGGSSAGCAPRSSIASGGRTCSRSGSRRCLHTALPATVSCVRGLIRMEFAIRWRQAASIASLKVIANLRWPMRRAWSLPALIHL